MTRTAVSLAGIVFDYPLYIKEYEYPKTKYAQKYVSANGSDIVFVNKNNTPEITLESKESGWQSQSVVDALRLLTDNMDGIHQLVYSDGDTDQVRIAFERESEMKFAPLFECSPDHYITIPLAKT